MLATIAHLQVLMMARATRLAKDALTQRIPTMTPTPTLTMGLVLTLAVIIRLRAITTLK